MAQIVVADEPELTPLVSLKSISGGQLLVGQSNSTLVGPGPVTRERTKYAP